MKCKMCGRRIWFWQKDIVGKHRWCAVPYLLRAIEDPESLLAFVEWLGKRCDEVTNPRLLVSVRSKYDEDPEPDHDTRWFAEELHFGLQQALEMNTLLHILRKSEESSDSEN